MVKILLALVMAALLGVAIMQFLKPQVPNTPSFDGLLVTSSTPSATPSTVATTAPLSTPSAASPSPSKSAPAVAYNNKAVESFAYKSKVLIAGVPFTPQAPLAEWKDARFQEGCEEASSLMAIYWTKNITSIDKTKARDEIIAMATYQTEKWGEARDTSAHDTVTRLIAGYFNFNNFEIKEDMSLQDIKNELLKGNVIIVPTNGRALNNPHFTAPGPDRHMIVIRGYDDNTGTFITNDPGIKEGELYTYPQQLFFNAIRDYPTGFNLPIVGDKKIMIVIKKS